MRALLTILLLGVFTTFGYSQMIVNGFETAAVDSFFQHPPVDPGLGTGGGGAILTDVSTPTPYHGSAAMKVEWTVHSTETWGGFIQLMHLTPLADSSYMDFSSANALTIWYYVVTPSSQSGLVNMRFKLHEAGGSSAYWSNQNDHEDWYFEVSGVYDAAPGWNMLTIPLVDQGGGSPNSAGFTLPGWSGVANNGTLDLDRIIGYSIEWTTPGIPSNGTATGVVLFDKLQFSGNRYTPLSTFDGAATDSLYTKDLMSWSGGNTGNLTFTDMTTQPFEGTSSLQTDWRVHNTEGWGGYVNFSYFLLGGAFYPDMKPNTDLLFAYKNTSASTLVGGVTMRFFLYDYSEGVEERWATALDVKLDSVSTDWTVLRIPLVDLGGGSPNSGGFLIPDWEAVKGNAKLDLDKIRGFRIEFTSPGPQGSIAEGQILFDLIIPTGFRETDLTPPPPPSGVLVAASTYANLVTWVDVPGEAGEKYDVFYSLNPITDVTAPGVEVVKLGVAENTQQLDHVLRAPATDQTVAYYYAVRAIDRVGNIGLAAPSSSTTSNTAKGVPTISLTPPATFTADGDLAEWSGITPISIKLSEGTGFVAPNGVVTDDADLSVLVYLAVDNQYLFVAFDIEDDVVTVDTTDPQTWMQDAADLFIGGYNFHGFPHRSLLRGGQPDYHFRFSENRVIEDRVAAYDLRPGANYIWNRKFPTGYTIEARIEWAGLATVAGDSLFHPLLGMRIPIDFSINDRDNAPTKREGIMTYSPTNEDQSYLDPARWTDTWIGNAWFVSGVEEDGPMPIRYELSQNYPNPFNPSTQITYAIEKDGLVQLKVYDLLGREVARLVNDYQLAGKYTVTFDASARGRLTTGAYFYVIESGDFHNVKKMLLVK